MSTDNAMSTDNSAVRTGFTVRVPESWWEFDVWRATRTGDLARLIDSRIAEAPELRPHRGTLLRMLREAAENAERHGARSCAVATDVVDDAGMLVATLMVFQRPPSPDPVHDTVDAIAGQVTAGSSGPGSPTWRRVEIVDIAAGRAVRVQGVEATDVGGRSIDAVVMQTLIPVPDDVGVLNVVLTSPQVELAEPLLELFDAISGTLTWSPG
jgi:hypothetical protein